VLHSGDQHRLGPSHWLLKIENVPEELRDDYPRLFRELNAFEHSQVPDWQQGLYRFTDDKWRLLDRATQWGTEELMARRTKLNPDQIPLIVPDSSWTIPTELPDLTKVGILGLDTETKDDGLAGGRGPGWVYGAGHICGVGVAWREGAELRKLYVPVRHPDTSNFPKDNVARWVKDIVKDNQVVFQNAPYDIGWLNADMGVPVPEGRIHDVGCMAVLIDESVRPTSGYPKAYSLDAICNRLGVQEKSEDLLMEAGNVYGFAKNEVKANLYRIPARYVGPYGEQDPASTLECYERQLPELAEQGLLAAYQLEMDLIPMVHAMRKRGIRIDLEHVETSISKLLERRNAVLKRLTGMLGGRLITMDDIRSSKWLWSTFSNQGVEYNDEGGKASFGKEWMRQGYVGRYVPGKVGHWLPQLIAEAKQCHEAADKFLQGFLLDFAHRGRIHASINQFKNEDGGTRTHRFSITDPPLQQMPSVPRSS
jgi:DNA polymerase I-like protein with 3'-5' exonuclease and polymerase domains